MRSERWEGCRCPCRGASLCWPGLDSALAGGPPGECGRSGGPWKAFVLRRLGAGLGALWHCGGRRSVGGAGTLVGSVSRAESREPPCRGGAFRSSAVLSCGCGRRPGSLKVMLI